MKHFCFLGTLKKAAIASSIDLNKIVSPVGQYIRSNPVPPIVRQIRPKITKNIDDELAMFERDEELCRNTPTPEKKRMFKPLPMAEYRSSKVALEQKMPSTSSDVQSLPKVFGVSPSVEAKVCLKVFLFCREREARAKVLSSLFACYGDWHSKFFAGHKT